MASNWGPSSDHFFKILLRDVNPEMVAAWMDLEAFGDDKFADLVEVRRVTYTIISSNCHLYFLAPDIVRRYL